jgi:hypothetical protein
MGRIGVIRKMRKLQTVAVLLLLAVFCIVEASATSQTITVKQAAPLPPTFSMSITPGDVAIPLSQGANSVTANAITIGGNTPWTLTARDDMANGKPAGTGGKMGQYKLFNGNPLWAEGNYFLSNPIKVGVSGGSLVSLSATDQTIKSGTEYSGNLMFEQTVVLTDPASISDGSYLYTIGVMFTGSSV